ncbi:MAG: acyl carrier protein [Pseudomonadales bacterium]|nr:acyl carrier protein [Pseudomonadales bacterium]
MEKQQTRAKLRSLILENYLFTDDESELEDEVSFLDTGILDSMGIMEVIAFLNEEFDIEVAEEEMIPENLDSIDNLLEYLARKRATV